MNETEQPTINHSQLVEAAAKWLGNRCSIVITELSTIGETPDAIGWHGKHSILVECKASRSDFLADKSKWFRREDWQGVGITRYFMVPPGIIALEELPAKWGLLELTRDSVRIIRESEYFQEANHRHEIGILLSTLRRVGQCAPSGVSIRCYTIKTQNRASFGVCADGENNQQQNNEKTM